MKTHRWNIKHIGSGMTLSGDYSMATDNDERFKKFINVMTADFRQFMGYGEIEEYEFKFKTKGQ